MQLTEAWRQLSQWGSNNSVIPGFTKLAYITHAHDCDLHESHWEGLSIGSTHKVLTSTTQRVHLSMVSGEGEAALNKHWTAQTFGGFAFF